MTITVYSTGCPKCKVLETKLKQKNIKYTINNDIEVMKSLGFSTVPMMIVEYVDRDTETLDFKGAVEWVNSMDYQVE